jgi:Poly (ADP-ribose) glycohydrolase (PARG)
MNNSLDKLICRHVFDTQKLVDSYPPKIRNSNKKIVYQIACPSDSLHRGQLTFSRWQALSLDEIPLSLDQAMEVEEQKCYFEYQPSNRETNTVEWYLNFAHFDLFCAYGDRLFAQDEIQVAEHPALASLRESLLSSNIKPLTVENGVPTPILIRGVERRCSIATDPNEAEGRPVGLYGNNFAKASPETITLAAKCLEPPTNTNIIAMEAPSGGYNFYEYDTIEYILTTALTGFSAAKVESSLEYTERSNKNVGESIVVIHTGFWGCGAYGGNRVLMALLQLLAARLARIDKLIFHTTDRPGSDALTTAQKILDQDLFIDRPSISDILDKIYSMSFKWGVGDGN